MKVEDTEVLSRENGDETLVRCVARWVSTSLSLSLSLSLFSYVSGACINHHRVWRPYQIRIVKAAKAKGADIRPVGVDIASGSCVVETPSVLSAVEIGLAAAVGVTTVSVSTVTINRLDLWPQTA